MTHPSNIGISKSNDLLMDVIRSADPARERRAIERLQGQSENDSFKNILDMSSPKSLVAARSLHLLPPHKIESQKSVGAAFESAMFSSLIENMFSTESESAFGSGVAGSSFKSLFAQQMAEQVVRHGGLGIGEIVEKYKDYHTTAGT